MRIYLVLVNGELFPKAYNTLYEAIDFIYHQTENENNIQRLSQWLYVVDNKKLYQIKSVEVKL